MTAAAVTLAVVAAVLEVVGIALTIRNIRSARDQLATFLSRPNTVYASAGLAAVSALAADVTSQNQTLEQRIDALEAWRRGLPDQLAWREQELSDTLRNDFRGALKASESTVGDQFMGLRDYVVGTGQTSWIKAYRGPFVQHRLCCLRRQNASMSEWGVALIAAGSAVAGSIVTGWYTRSAGLRQADAAKHAGDRQADALIHTLQATLDEQRRARAEERRRQVYVEFLMVAQDLATDRGNGELSRGLQKVLTQVTVEGPLTSPWRPSRIRNGCVTGIAVRPTRMPWPRRISCTSRPCAQLSAFGLRLIPPLLIRPRDPE